MGGAVSGLVAARAASCTFRQQVSLSHRGRGVRATVDRVKEGYKNGINVPFARAMATTVPSSHTNGDQRVRDQGFLAQCSNIDVLRGSVAANSSQLEIARTPGKSNWIALIGPTVRRNDRKR